MWEAIYSPSYGKLAVRRLLKYALATVVAAFLWAILVTPATHAIDASWNGASISYDGQTYIGPTPDKTLEDLNLLKGTKAYTFVEPPATGTPSTSPTSTRYIRVIYFASDVDVSVATSAKYKTYIYQGPSDFSNPSDPEDISIDQQTTSTSGASSCDKQGSLGWIICPVTGWLASGMDWVFNTLSGFLTVRPAQSGQDSVLYRAWSMMRSIANIAFVIAFLVIIYSQLTNLGINNYSMKKLLPRLVVAAVLVNISFYICSVAIDLSNILGYSFQDLFITIRNSLVGTSGNSWELSSWESISGFILSGGTVAAAGGIAAVTTISTFGIAGSIFLLLPSLLVGLLAVLTALVVMAARQAVITILVIVAPLAFVAYLLPNTEKWFDKWRSTFMTLLVLFPAFSLIFGGSQLAASAIIQNADSINQVILGMLVQVAPLMITPMLMKLSGSLVGKFAGIVNNPNKGIIDRTRNWSKDRADNKKADRLGSDARRFSYLKKNGQRMNHNRRLREEKRKLNEGRADNRYLGSKDNKELHEDQYKLDTDKKTIDERLSRDLSLKIKADPKMLDHEMTMRVTADEATAAKARLDKMHEDLKTGKDTSDSGAALSGLTERSSKIAREIALTAMATQAAKRVQQQDISRAMKANTEIVGDSNQTIRAYAAGIEGDKGEISALANAVAAENRAVVDLVSERAILAKEFELNFDQMQALAEGKESATGKTTDANGNETSFTFDVNDKYTVRAAIEEQLKIGTYQNRIDIIMNTAKEGSKTSMYKQLVSQSIPANRIDDLAVFMGGATISEVAAGKVSTREDLLDKATRYIADGKFNASKLSTNDPGAIAILLEAAKKKKQYTKAGGGTAVPGHEFEKNVEALKQVANAILDRTTSAGENATEATRAALENLRQLK